MTHQIFSQKIETWLWEKKQNGYIGPQTLMAEMLDVRFQSGIWLAFKIVNFVKYLKSTDLSCPKYSQVQIKWFI